MKNKKQMIRIFSIFLMVCIMVSLMPATFLADKTTQEIPADAIHISTPEDLTALAENCQRNTWSVDKTVVLDNDIDVTEYEFSGIPTFGGTFLGQGFTIKGLEMTKEGSVLGFFRYLQETAVVDDLHL